MNYDDLLPCPFCGSAKHLRYEFAGSQGYICCDNCGTQGPCDERAADPICDDDAAYAAWNRRADLAEPEPSVDDVLLLAAIIREVDGTNRSSASRLAEDILSHPASRWGNHPGSPDSSTPQPAAGEVAELVAWLRDRAAGNDRFGAQIAAALMNRAADLLERLAPQPVPVSERLPGPEDCDAEGRCWFLFHGEAWVLTEVGQPGLIDGTHWLPAHALPLPGEWKT